MNQNNSVVKLLTIIGLAVLATVAGWQFYLFATFKDANGAVDVQGGTLHLWLAIGITMLVSLGGFFVFSGALHHEGQNDLHIATQGSPLGVAASNKGIS